MNTLPSRWRPVATGCGFTEGPVWTGSDLVFVSVNRGVLYRTALDGAGSCVQVELGGGPNGAAVDGDGRIWIAQNGGRVLETKSFEAPAGVQVVSAHSVTSLDVSQPRGTSFSAPNDCAFGPDGRLYITDPRGRLHSADGTGPAGRIWAVDVTDGATEMIAGELPHPNGLAFIADGSELWVSDTKTNEIVAYSRTNDGGWDSRVVDIVPWGAPDGVAFDVSGNLWVAATSADGIAVRTREGTWTLVELGHSFPTNVAFAGEQRDKVVATVARGGRVLISAAEVPGIPLFAPPIALQAEES